MAGPALTGGGGGGTGVDGASIVAEVEKFLGDSYVYGGTGPASFDCSGLVQYTLEQLGLTGVPRTSEAQWAWVTKISASQLQPGDLVFAQFPGDNASPGHVGIYTGNGQVLSAQDPALGVGYSTLASWGPNIVGYGQVPGSTPGGPVSTGPSPAPVSGGGTDLLTGYMSQASGLLHALAVLIDRAFALFAPGQGWRIVFAAATVVLALLAYHSFGGSVSIGGAGLG